MVSTAEKIRYIREIRGLSQQAVADAAHMNVALYKQYEYGIRNPKNDQLQKLAQALNVDIAFLYPSHLGDSPLSIFALLLNWINQYGDIDFKVNGTKAHINIDFAGQVSLIEKLNFLENAHNQMPLEDFKKWLTDPYTHIHNEQIVDSNFANPHTPHSKES